MEGRASATPPRRGFQLVRPYSTLAGAKAALDNGGRFYHLIARAGDARIAKSELAKAAGTVLDEKSSFLYLDMSLAALAEEEKAEVVAMLGPKLARRYRESGPKHAGAGAVARGLAGKTFVVEGVPRFARSVVILQTGMIPVGKVMVPVTHELPHDVYELDGGLPVAIWRKKERLPEAPTRFGGPVVLQRVKAKPRETKERMLMARFHTPLVTRR